LVPVQSPEALHDVTFVLDQVNVVLALRATPGGLAERLTDGVPAVTLTVAVFAALPPAPAHVIVNVEFAVKAPVLWVPDVPLAPDQAPDAAQLVAFVVLHVSCDEAPDCTLVGDALKLTVGAGVVTATAAVCATDPPLLVQVRV
jgi:hypothetical protein